MSVEDESRPAVAPVTPIRNDPAAAIPYDLDAEESLLGSMLLTREAITAAVHAGIEPADFYKPAHGRIYTAILQTHAAGEMPDPVIVANRLADPLLPMPMLLHIQAAAPASVNAGAYARIVGDAARRRRMMVAARELEATARDGGDAAQSLARLTLLTTPTEPSAGLMPLDLGPILDGEAPTAQATMWERTDGACLLYPAMITAFQAEPSGAKAQPLDTNVLTPNGWTPMGDLTVGSSVIGSDGRATAVTGVFPQGTIPIYRITCSDGATVEACGGHLWQVQSHNNIVRGQGGQILTTLQVRDALWAGCTRDTYLPMLAAPVEYTPSAPLPIDPYLLGLLLGDGGLTKNVMFTSADPELHAAAAALCPPSVTPTPVIGEEITVRLSSPRGRPNPLLDQLRAIGVMGQRSTEKHIPELYLRSSAADRLALLQGLLDTDGTVAHHVSCSTSSPALADGIIDLVEGLGGRASLRKRSTACAPSYGIHVKLPAGIEPFRLARKRDRWRQLRTRTAERPPRRKIVSVDYIGEKPAQCILVAAPDHLYVTERHIVTHNTMLALHACAEQMLQDRHCLYVDFEGDVGTIIERIRALGVPDGQILAHFGYIRPEGPFTATDRLALIDMAATRAAAIVVFDTLAAALALHGLNEDKAGEVLQFMQPVCRSIARTGSTVLVLDHVTKDKDTRGRWARGSGGKLGEVDAAYNIHTITGFDRKTNGHVRLKIAKDRYGGIGIEGEPIAEIYLQPRELGKVVNVRITPPEGLYGGTDEFLPTQAMLAVSLHLEAVAVPVSGKSIENTVTGYRASILRAAITALERLGNIRIERSGRAHLHHLITPYRIPDTQPDNPDETDTPEDALGLDF